jgi:hypothetical protein
MQVLASEILDLSSCLADIRDHARLQLLQDKVIGTLQTINDAAVFMKGYLDLNVVGRFYFTGLDVCGLISGLLEKSIAAQFRFNLDTHSLNLIREKESLKIAMQVQILQGMGT